MAEITQRYHHVLARMGEAALKAGRDPRTIRLLAASKSQSSEVIGAALYAGVTLLGENYVQEAQEKKRAIFLPAEWHMIGHLQRNKVKAAVELFDVIETLDSAALARVLDREGERKGLTVRTLIEVNLAAEESKSGVAPEGIAALLEEVANLRHVAVEGLMTVPPAQESPEGARRYFHSLRELSERYRSAGISNVRLEELSMGMSDDFAVAIEEGATIVRIGTALFGPRAR